MRIIAFTTAHWNSAEEFDALWRPESLFGLSKWYDRVRMFFDPLDLFIACGTWSEPEFCPLPVVNSGVELTKQYDARWWAYAGCAQTAAHAYLLNRKDWDLAVELDQDCLVGAVDFDGLLREFIGRSELLLTPNWLGKPGGPFLAFKRDGVARWLHQRRRANLVEQSDGAAEPMLLEEEFGEIFKGCWWNAWPENSNQRYECGVTDEEAMAWPFVRRPSGTMVERYLAEQTSRAKAVKR